MDDQFISEINRVYGEKFVVTKSRNGFYGVEMLGDYGVPRDAMTKPMIYEEAIALRQLLRGSNHG
jgi:hypothetical protein